jgi:hypothetical protein
MQRLKAKNASWGDAFFGLLEDPHAAIAKTEPNTARAIEAL